MPFVNIEEVWADLDDRMSKEEGWIMTNDPYERFYIARPESCDLVEYSDPKFGDDVEALDYVVSKAGENSIVHLKALYLHGLSIDIAGREPVWVPDFLMVGVSS